MTTQNKLNKLFKIEVEGIKQCKALGQLKNKALYMLGEFMRFYNGSDHLEFYDFISYEFARFLNNNGIKTHQNGIGYRVIYKEI